MARSKGVTTPNALYYGDNLEVLRRVIATESVDLIYLDPPFNSNRSYNVLFKHKTGTEAQAQIEAFDDTWTWSQESFASEQLRSGASLFEVQRLMGQGDIDLVARTYGHLSQHSAEEAIARAATYREGARASTA